MKPFSSHAPSGAVLVDKPEGFTSFEALSSIKRRVGHKKVGHAGTLDKFASGLLVVLIGPYTKLSSYLTGLDKSYHGVMRFGERTSTLDPEGERIEEASIPEFEAIQDGITAFTGSFDQVPPKYSAVHVDGERAYRRALSGEDPHIPARKVRIYDFSIDDWSTPDLRFSLSCSKGTYVRSLARDLGAYCKSAAYLRSLRRNSIGSFSVSRACSPEEFDPDMHLLSDRELIKSLEDCRIAVVNKEGFDRVQKGSKIDLRALRDEDRTLIEGGDTRYEGKIALFDTDDRLIAMTDYRDASFVYRFVIPRSPTEENV